MLLSKLKKYADSDAIAIINGDSSITFRQVWRISEAIAIFLEENNVEKPVVIFGDKENVMLPCMIGCIKAGITYVPIPSYYPAGRVRDMVEDCGAELVFNPAENKIPVETCTIITAEDIWALTERYQASAAPAERYKESGSDDACILYTSGSTGKPKGVRISYDNLAYYEELYHPFMMETRPQFGHRSINFASYSFSASLSTIFYTFVSNCATIISIPRSVLLDQKCLIETLIKNDPHRIVVTPSLIAMLLSSEKFSPVYLKSLMFIGMGGEPLPLDLMNKVLDRFPNVCAVCGYGATEASGGPMFFRLSKDVTNTKSAFAPIGRPAKTAGAYLEDENGNIIEEDETVGELVLTGQNIANGYLHMPNEKSSSFFTTDAGVHCYRTHDIVRRYQGDYYYLGRKDNQIKIGGNRIEVEDVEANLKTSPLVKSCGVGVKRHENGDVSLVAFVVPTNPAKPRLESFLEIKSWMKDRVLSCMIPAKIIFVDKLPLNMNMKIDRVELSKMIEAL